MSNPRAKAERSKTKDLRQMPVQDKRIKSRSKKKKPVVVEYRWRYPVWKWMGKGWSTFGRYRSIEIAEEVMNNQERKAPGQCEMRIRGKSA